MKLIYKDLDKSKEEMKNRLGGHFSDVLERRKDEQET